MKALRPILALALAGPLLLSRLGAVESAPYLVTNEGVRAVALAGAFGAVQGSTESLWYNPAGLPGLSGVEASLAHMSFVGA